MIARCCFNNLLTPGLGQSARSRFYVCERYIAIWSHPTSVLGVSPDYCSFLIVPPALPHSCICSRFSLSLECSPCPPGTFSECPQSPYHLFSTTEWFLDAHLQLDPFLLWIPGAPPIHLFWCSSHGSLHPGLCILVQWWCLPSTTCSGVSLSVHLESSQRHHRSVHTVDSQYIILKEEYTKVW